MTHCGAVRSAVRPYLRSVQPTGKCICSNNFCAAALYAGWRKERDQFVPAIGPTKSPVDAVMRCVVSPFLFLFVATQSFECDTKKRTHSPRKNRTD